MNTETPTGVRRIISDIADLADLQMQLLSVDGQEAGRRGITAIVLVAVAVTLLVSTLTVALMGFGWVLHQLVDWSIGLSLLAVAGVALLVTLMMLGLAYMSIKRAAAALGETGAEFAENMRWIKAVLTAPQSPRNQIRSGRYPELAYPEIARSGRAAPQHRRY